MLSVLRVALVWLLVLIAVPIGGAPLERGADPEACESWCPCDEAESTPEHDEAHGDDEAPCDESCDEDCGRCCDARVPLAVVGLVGLSSTGSCATTTGGLPALDAPGCRVATGVFRPPRSLA